MLGLFLLQCSFRTRRRQVYAVGTHVHLIGNVFSRSVNSQHYCTFFLLIIFVNSYFSNLQFEHVHGRLFVMFQILNTFLILGFFHAYLFSYAFFVSFR